MSSIDDPAGPPRRKKRRILPGARDLEVVAPQATLDGLPDEVLFLIMAHLNFLSLFRLSLVCRRLQHLSRDPSVWEDVTFTRHSLGKRVDTDTMKKLIRRYTSAAVHRVTLEETHFKGNTVITEALVKLLFSSCSRLEAITLLNCDLKKFKDTCPLFKNSSLKSVTLRGCEMKLNWLSSVEPTWPHLETLSLENSVMTNNTDLHYITTKKTWRESIKHLDVRGCYRLSLAQLVEACHFLKNLQTLRFSRSQFSKEQFLQHLQNKSTLRLYAL